jgi:transaldolase
MNKTLQDLSSAGVAIWLDDLSRDRLATGDLASLIVDKCVVGVTTNPSIFQAAITGSELYDDQVRELAATGADSDAIAHALTVQDVREAADLLMPAAEASGGVDGRVSIEVDPRLAHDTDGTLAQARALWQEVDRPNLLIKIPATVEGLPAIRTAIREGISVNVTLIFSLERYRAVMTAYLDGLEDRMADGAEVTGIASVASFFVSRVDTAVDKQLDAMVPRTRPRCWAGPRSPTRAWPTRRSRRPSPGHGGSAWPQPVPGHSARSGRRRASKIPATPTRCT